MKHDFEPDETNTRVCRFCGRREEAHVPSTDALIKALRGDKS